MKVILLQDVGGVGKRGEVREVSDGYAINFLIPRSMAKQATKQALESHEKALAEVSEEHKLEEEALRKNIERVHGMQVEIQVKATEKGGLFKSIGAADVARAIKNAGIEIEPASIKIAGPIKTVGEHTVVVEGAGERAEVRLLLKAA